LGRSGDMAKLPLVFCRQLCSLNFPHSLTREVVLSFILLILQL
jgi:hypothetical protein